ncbi:hypothetical protein NDU88_004492 [Pleurodeles waltl]|uniref:Uncharacterized protein n=1 Tax=Pleurodeles waltl TaxID=8319 RepID=A0AAV7RJB1_PLEWA|nr:hypothetical protein NDU88_004492 [Pleurodeles waltl]
MIANRGGSSADEMKRGHTCLLVQYSGLAFYLLRALTRGLAHLGQQRRGVPPTPLTGALHDASHDARLLRHGERHYIPPHN